MKWNHRSSVIVLFVSFALIMSLFILDSERIYAGVSDNDISESVDQTVENDLTEEDGEPTGVGGFVWRCYKVALGREPENDGFEYWKNLILESKKDGTTVAFGFIFSDEYKNRNTSNEQYVRDLYSMFMGREPDEAGFNDWTTQLANGASREQIFAGFANSVEFYNLCNGYGITAGYFSTDYNLDQLNNVNLFVERLYKVCLDRIGDQNGQNDWTLKLLKKELTGTQCAANFIKSREYENKGLSNSDYVKNLYRAFMGREYDESGYNYWLNELSNGKSRDEIFAGFANSKEFNAICASYGIDCGTYTPTDTGASDRRPDDQNVTVSDSQFEKKGYIYHNSIGNTIYYYIVKNNSSTSVCVEGDAVAKDASGNSIGACNRSIDVLGAGETGIMQFYFDGNVDHVDCNLRYTKTYYRPVLSNLRVDSSVNNTNVVLSITNTGSYAAEFVEAYVLFFDESGNVVYGDERYFCDQNSEIKPGDKQTDEIDYTGRFSRVEYYINGRASSSASTNGAVYATAASYPVTVYGYQDTYSNRQFVTVKNNSGKTAALDGNIIAYDSTGKMIGADAFVISVIGPGEESIAPCILSSVTNVDHVDYVLRVYDTSYKPVISGLSASVTRNQRNVVMAVTNNGSADAEFVEAYVLFFNNAGTVIGCDERYFVDNDSKLRAGATITGQLNYSGNGSYSNVKYWFTGRR